MKRTGWYTILDSLNPSVQKERKVTFLETEEFIVFTMDTVGTIRIDRQQVGELGILFLTLAREFDYDAATELLEIETDEELKNLKEKLRVVVDGL